MQIRNVFIGIGVFSLFGFLFLFELRNPSLAATRTINIINSMFDPASQTIYTGDKINFENEDAIGHVLEIKRATDSAVLHTETFAPKASATPDSYNRTFNTVGNFVLTLDTNGATGLVTVNQATPSATPTASATATESATPTAIPTVQPTATVTATPSETATASPTIAPTASATALPTATATAEPTGMPTPVPTVEPTVTPTIAPTVTPTATATVEPTMSATPSAVPTETPVPTMSPTPTVSPTPVVTVTPTAMPTATPTMSPTPVATATPTIAPTASAAPTVTPTVTPSATPVATALPTPAVLPAFSVFKTTSCSAQLVTNNTQVKTDKTTSTNLLRGWWNITSLNTSNNMITAVVNLFQTQKFNLFFGYNSFFGGVKSVAANENATFEGASVPIILQKASNAWCAR